MTRFISFGVDSLGSAGKWKRMVVRGFGSPAPLESPHLGHAEACGRGSGGIVLRSVKEQPIDP